MQEYRTQKQFFEICDSIINGNYQQAIDEAIEYGFSAVDLANYAHEFEDVTGFPDTNFFYICEGIGKAKSQKEIDTLKEDVKQTTYIYKKAQRNYEYMFERHAEKEIKIKELQTQLQPDVFKTEIMISG